MFCGFVSWRLISLYNHFCYSVWRCEKRYRWFYVFAWVCRDFSVYVLCVLSKFLPCSTQNKCFPSQLTYDPCLSDVTVLPANQSEFRSFRLPWQLCCSERRGEILSTLCCAAPEFFMLGLLNVFLSVGWDEFSALVLFLKMHWIDSKAIFLGTRKLSFICIQKALLNRWCPELMSLNSLWSCWNFKEL